MSRLGISNVISKATDINNVIENMIGKQSIDFKRLLNIVANYRICFGTRARDIEAIGNEINFTGNINKALNILASVLKTLETDLNGFKQSRTGLTGRRDRHIHKASLANLRFMCRCLQQSAMLVREEVQHMRSSIHSLSSLSRIQIRELWTMSFERNQAIWLNRIKKAEDEKSALKSKLRERSATLRRLQSETQLENNSTEIRVPEIDSFSSVKSEMEAALIEKDRTIELLKTKLSKKTNESEEIRNLELRCSTLEDQNNDSTQTVAILQQKLQNMELLMKMREQKEQAYRQEVETQMRVYESTIKKMKEKPKQAPNTTTLVSEEKIKYLSEIIEMKDEENRRLREQLSQCDNRSFGSHLKTEDWNNRIVELKEQHQTRIDSLNEVLQQKESIIKSLMEENVNLSGPNLHGKSVEDKGIITELRHQNDKLMQMCADREAKNHHITEQLEATKQQLLELQYQNKKLQIQVKFMKGITKEKSKLEKEMNTLKSQMSTSMNVETSLNIKLQEMETTSRIQDERMKSKADEIDSLKSTIEEQKLQLEQIKVQQDVITEMRVTIERQTQENAQLISALERSKRKLKNVVSRAQDELESRNATESELEAHIAEQNLQLKKLGSKYTKLKDSTDAIQQMFNSKNVTLIPEKIRILQNSLSEKCSLLHEITSLLGLTSETNIMDTIKTLMHQDH